MGYGEMPGDVSRDEDTQEVPVNLENLPKPHRDRIDNILIGIYKWPTPPELVGLKRIEPITNPDKTTYILELRVKGESEEFEYQRIFVELDQGGIGGETKRERYIPETSK